MSKYGQSVTYRRKQGSGRGAAKQHERILQRNLTKWLAQEYPDIDFYNDWASGAFLTVGQNQARMALASNNGWVDLFIAQPSRGFHGLFIELKKEGVRPYLKDGVTLCADPQIRKEAEFLVRKNRQGYCARFACGLEKAQALIDWYFETDRPVSQTLF